MNVMMKCCYRSLRENRKRTVVTIVGIVLATALITAVACMVVSFRASMIAYEKEKSGAYHYLFSGVSAGNLKYFRNNKNIERLGLRQEVGYAVLEGSQNPDKPYLYVSAVDAEGIDILSLRLVEGRMPENDGELVVGRHLRTNGLVDIKVGDVLTLPMGRRMSEGYALGQNNGYIYEEEALEPAFERTYTVVGIIERPNFTVEERIAPGYSAFTYMEDAGGESLIDVYACYTDWGLHHAGQVTAGILGVPEELYQRYLHNYSILTAEEARQVETVAGAVNENYWLLKWQLMIFASSVMNMLYAMSALAVLVIIVTSVFCIRNSFAISLTEKMKLYGRLASVGTTASQRRKLVYYEAAILGGAGIPLGTACGIAATAVLVKAVGGLMEDAVEIKLVFGISLPIIVLGAALSAVTVLFSAMKSARQAAKISPISAIRANDTVRIGRRALRCPRLVERLFGVGGRVAYKNLQRAKVKYRTTVVSIVVSVAAFIGLSTFTKLLSIAADIYYENEPCPLVVRVWDSDGDGCYREAVRLAGLEEVQEADICRTVTARMDAARISYTEAYLEEFGIRQDGEEHITVMSLGEEGYARYCGKLGVPPESARGKAVLVAYFENVMQDKGKRYETSGDIADFCPGDVLKLGLADSGEETELEVLMQTREVPMSMEGRSYNGILLIVADEWMDRWKSAEDGYAVNVHIRCRDAGKLEEVIRREVNLPHYTITNYEAQYRSEKSTHLLVSIFLYGFITVVALIGITNIFNTVTTNMELRAPEFAMLKSVGMTNKEFGRMIWLEGLFYGGRALLFGIPIGLLVSFGFHWALSEGIVTAFRFPWEGMFLSAAAVFVLLYVIMRYSMAKINRKNIIETIQNENI